MGTTDKPGGVFLPGEIAGTLKPGTNTIRVKTLTKSGTAPRAAVGLIDWGPGIDELPSAELTLGD